MGLEWAGPAPCRLAAAYQAVRNVAAVKALAGESRRAVLCLLYDARNPYFRPTGPWPGWHGELERLLARSKRVEFRALSWQQLVPKLPLDEPTREWAQRKHTLGLGFLPPEVESNHDRR